MCTKIFPCYAHGTGQIWNKEKLSSYLKLSPHSSTEDTPLRNAASKNFGKDWRQEEKGETEGEMVG